MPSLSRALLAAATLITVMATLLACDNSPASPVASGQPSPTPSPGQAGSQSIVLTVAPVATQQSASPQAEPTSTDDYLKRARNYIKSGDYTAAIADLNRVLELSPNNPAAYMDRGVARFRSGDFTTAMSDFDTAIKLDPTSAEAHYDRGAAYFESHDLHSAIADLDEAIKLNPKYDQAYFTRGYAKQQSGDKSGAIADYKQVLAISANQLLKGQAQTQLKGLGQ